MLWLLSESAGLALILGPTAVGSLLVTDTVEQPCSRPREPRRCRLELACLAARRCPCPLHALIMSGLGCHSASARPQVLRLGVCSSGPPLPVHSLLVPTGHKSQPAGGCLGLEQSSHFPGRDLAARLLISTGTGRFPCRGF